MRDTDLLRVASRDEGRVALNRCGPGGGSAGGQGDDLAAPAVADGDPGGDLGVVLLKGLEVLESLVLAGNEIAFAVEPVGELVASGVGGRVPGGMLEMR